jgi:hypothetical protein
LILLACCVLCFVAIGVQWLVFRGQKQHAAIRFWALAALINVLYAASCVAPDIYLVVLLFLGWAIMVPMLAGLGVAWARSATREATVPRRSSPSAWVSLIAVCLLPLVTLLTFWPLRLSFLVFRPSLDRLADQVAAGQAVGFPRWVGPFRVADSAVDPVSSNVGLMIEPNPNGPSGFVRVRPAAPPNRVGPFPWDDLLVDLGRGWEYREAD